MGATNQGPVDAPEEPLRAGGCHQESVGAAEDLLVSPTGDLWVLARTRGCHWRPMGATAGLWVSLRT